MNENDWLVWLLVMLNNIAIVTIFGISMVMEKQYRKVAEELHELRRKVGV
jgi:hypothetical protein